jgi:hypothetical protein
VNHHVHFIIGIEEIVSAGPDDDHQRAGKRGAHRTDHAGAGGGSSFRQVRAKFDTIRSTRRGRAGRCDTINADFEHRGQCFIRGARRQERINRMPKGNPWQGGGTPILLRGGEPACKVT